MTLNQFVANRNGKKLDFESRYLEMRPFPPSQPYQCWDLGAFYNYEVIGGGKNFYTGNGCACGVYTNFEKGPLTKFYRKYAYSPGFRVQSGDIVFWKCSLNGSGGCGHVDIALTSGTSSFIGFDQNWGGAYAHKVNHNMQMIMGVLRPKSNIATPSKPATSPVYYTLRYGDYLNKVASLYHITLGRIRQLNPNIKDPNKVPIGLKVRVR